MVRACSYRDPDPYRHSGDYVAAALPGTPLRLGARLGPFRRLLGRFSRRGLYEWVVARTRYVDDVFERFGPSMAQVLIMGAGYDSRAIRFEGALRSARVFEVDAPAPQADKRRGLELRKLPVPANLVFVAVDFETQSAATRLAEAGFRPGLATLFVLEGLTMYLEPATVDGTLQTVADLAGGGSVLVFDYAYADVVGGDEARFGAQGTMDAVAGVGESWRFGIEEGTVREFVSRYGFELIDDASPAELERRFLTDPSGRIHGRVNGTQAIATARRP